MANIVDVFNGDAFGVISMTKNINNVPYKPRFLEDMGLFEGDGAGSGMAGIDTQQLAVVNVRNVLTLIPAAALATMPNFQDTDPEDIRYITVPHLPLNDTVLAHELPGKTRFGDMTGDVMSPTQMVSSVQQAVTKKQAKMVENHNLTWEWQRVASIKGILLDADGSKVLYNWFETFGITPNTTTYTPATPGDIDVVCDKINKDIPDALGNDSFTGITMLVGADFMTAVTQDASLNDGFIRLNDGEFYRSNFIYGSFEYKGINFVHYRGNVGGTPYIADDKGFAFPTGTNSFIRRNAPGDLDEAVRRPGLPMYSARERKRFGTGWDLHSQSNPIFMCQRPEVLVEVTLA